MTLCNSCESFWVTGESVNWKRDSCVFCGSEDLDHSDYEMTEGNDG